MQQKKFSFPVIESGASFSPCGLYRYDLWRTWDKKLPTLVCIGLNPSTADATQNDPTVYGMLKRATSWGFGRFVMLNAFAFRSTQPAGLLKVADPVGEGNDVAILAHCLGAGRVVCAWGSGGAASKLIATRGPELRAMLRAEYLKPEVFRLNKDGNPKHPLYCGLTALTFEWKLA